MLAIIGGTGIYNIDDLQIVEEVDVDTPFGKPSAKILKAEYKNKEILFLPRHGKSHQFLPHEVNYAANIFALKKLGAKQIIGISAVGSLQENIHPGDLAIPEQYFDWIKGNRTRTFFGDGLAAHISTAQPTCPDLTKWISQKADKMGIAMHVGKTYACVDGPRLGTKAESNFLRMAHCDLVGMTNVPEVFLAREAQICYATIGIVTDYDCWMEDPSQHVSVSAVIERYGESLQRAKSLILELLKSDIPQINEDYRQSLKDAVLTPNAMIPEDKFELLEILRA
ncbi:S-methyl-5'-thioadenosine phosphorylase [Rickettsiales bacterium]|nr:S-methyl-5'-thioadenosine phosphorylase [Rickettsiales bacterium]